jgi:hypothetical protein
MGRHPRAYLMIPTKVQTGPGGSLPTAAFPRVTHAPCHMLSKWGQQEVTGDNWSFAERESPAVRRLKMPRIS